VQATVAPWRGTPGQLVRVISCAADLLAEEIEAQPTVWVEAQYRDGRDLFENMRSLKEASSTLPIHRLVAITANLNAPGGQQIQVHASRAVGVRIQLESEREVFVLGARSVLESRLRENRDDRAINRMAAVGIGIITALLAGTVVAARYGSETLATALMFAAVVALGLTTVGLPILVSKTTQLTLLSVEQASTSEPGPILKAQAWIQRHPVVGGLLLFITGVATNEVADLI
jgi:hypothetical protein